MSKYPGISSVYTNNGGVECMIGARGKAVPITIDGARGNSTIKGPSLFARRTASPYKAIPLMNSTAVKDPTNTTNATIDVADADAAKFKVGDAITYWDVSASAFYSGANKTISAIGAPGSGGTGETRITLTGTWTTPPDADDVAVVADGAQLSANAVMVLEDVVLDGVNDVPAAGFVTGQFMKGKVNNTTYFNQHENQNLLLVDMQ